MLLDQNFGNSFSVALARAVEAWYYFFVVKRLKANSATELANFHVKDLRYESQNRPQLLGASLKLAASLHFKVGLKSCGGTHHEFVLFYLACCGQTLDYIIDC